VDRLQCTQLIEYTAQGPDVRLSVVFHATQLLLKQNNAIGSAAYAQHALASNIQSSYSFQLDRNPSKLPLHADRQRDRHTNHDKQANTLTTVHL